MDHNATYTMKIGQEIYNYTDKILSKWITLPKDVADFFSYEILDNTLYQWSFTIVTLIFFFIFRNVLTKLVEYLLNKLSKRFESYISTHVFNSIHKPIKWTILLIGFNIAVSALDIEKSTEEFIVNLFYSFRVFLTVWILFLGIDLLYGSWRNLTRNIENQSFHNFLKLSKRVVKIIIFLVSAIFFLSVWGYNVNGLLASLGLVGMAVALAAQDTTKNIFGAMMIFADTPFKVGDWIQTADTEGYIEEIGMRSTKIRTFSDSIISVPNGVIANASVTNWSAMTKRRIKMNIDLTYSTTASQMQTIVEELRELLQNDEDIDQKTVLVYFSDFNSSSLGIFCYFFTKSTIWAEHLQVKEKINLRIMDIVHKNGASFAFPSQSLYIENENLFAKKE